MRRRPAKTMMSYLLVSGYAMNSPSAARPPFPDSSPGVADQVERVAPSVVAIATDRRGGAAGLLWQADVVVSSATAIAHERRPCLVGGDGRAVEGELIGIDPDTDLAAVRVSGVDARAIEQSGDLIPRVGDFVFAVARDVHGGLQASFGHVGATGGAWRSWRGGRIEHRIRLDGGLYRGFNGAAVADCAGRVLGMATSALSRRHGIVLPNVCIDRVLGELLQHGHVRRPYLGIMVQPARTVSSQGGTAAAREVLEGLLVSSVAEDAPADLAGLRVGDILLTLDEIALVTPEDLQQRLQDCGIGASVLVGLLRAGQRLSLTITLGERPAARHARGCCTP